MSYRETNEGCGGKPAADFRGCQAVGKSGGSFAAPCPLCPLRSRLRRATTAGHQECSFVPFDRRRFMWFHVERRLRLGGLADRNNLSS